MFGIFKKKSAAPSWNSLSKEQKSTVISKLARAYKNMARYKIVTGFDQYQREAGQVEKKNEDEILSAYGRGRLLDMARQAARNSTTFNTILKQMDYNVCGVKAGKVILNFPDVQMGKELQRLFAKFTRSADFFDGLSFNAILKLILKNQLIGGDTVILFDNGLIEDSGKLVVYESDEIGNTTEEAIKSHFGAGAKQSLGKVYNQNGRWIGAVVSRSQRGNDEFDPAKCYFLKRDPDASMFDSLWLMPSNVWRVNQGRGVTQSASSLGAIIDLEDLCGFELAAAKKNSQTFAQIINTKTSEDESVPSAFNEETDFDSMSEQEIQDAVKAEVKANETVVALNKAASCGIIYEQLPDNYKFELLDTKHPNQNMQDFIEWMAGRSSAVFGLSRAFATLNPDGDLKSHQLMTQPAFTEAQKQLEQICDWTFYQFVKWADKRGMFDMAKLPEDWMQYVSWSFPTLAETDENSHQDAVGKKLANLTGSLRDELGPNWRDTLEQIREEINYCKEHGLPHPSFNLKSGGERSETTTIDGENNN